ncbi:MAG: hypothetical protein ACM3H8_03660, partial [Sphingobacteriales bacterium]
MKKIFTSALLIVSFHLFAQNGLSHYAIQETKEVFASAYTDNTLFPPVIVPEALIETNAIGDYRSRQSGDWSLVSTWERFDGSSWVSATVAPTSSDGAINILNSHTVTVTTPITADQVTVDAGGFLSVSSSFALTDGTGDDLIVNGTLNLSSGAVSNSSGSLSTVMINGTASWSGGNWQNINMLTVASGAIMNISGTASQLSNGTLSNYGIINWSGGNLILSTYVLINYSGAVINISGNNTMTAGTCGGSPCPVTFTNNGIISKSSTGATDLLLGNNSGTIKGVGTINCPNLVSKGGVILPAGTSSIEILTINGGQLFNSFTSTPFVAASNYIAEIQDASGPGVGHDQLKRAGSLALSGTLTIAESANVPSGSYVIISLTSGTISGFFSSFISPPGYLINTTSTSVTVQKGTCNAPITNNTITAPAVTSFCGAGDPAVINGSTATGGSGAISYQWQQQIGTDIYRDVIGATSLNYDPPTLTQTTNYRRLAYSGSCSGYSSVVTITITGGSTSAPTITAGSATTFCSGGAVTLTSSSATGNQWYKDGVLISGATNQTYSTNASGSYTVTVTANGCTSIASNAIVVTVNAIPSAPIITAGSATTFC